MELPSLNVIRAFASELQRLADVLAHGVRQKSLIRYILLLDASLILLGNPFVLPLVTAKLNVNVSWPFWYVVVWASFAVGLFVWAVILVSAIKPERDLSNPTSTIKGLRPYEFEDTSVFAHLGRDRLLRDVIENITAQEFSWGILTGESGSGKTSFLQAAVIPAITIPNRSIGVYVKLSNLDPIETIRLGIQRAFIHSGVVLNASDSNQIANVAPENLLVTCIEVSKLSLFLVLDQFEQIFTPQTTREAREPFFELLRIWHRQSQRTSIKILISLRQDFVGKLVELQQLLRYNLGPQDVFAVDRFSPSAAIDVFTFLARHEGLDFDPGVVREIMENDLASSDERTVSPAYVQILLMISQTTTGAEDAVKNRRTFKSTGGIHGLLRTYVERVLRVRKHYGKESITLRVLLALADFSTGLRAGVMSADEISSVIPDSTRQDIVEVLEYLARSDVRLITEIEGGSGVKYELAHELLIRVLQDIAGNSLLDWQNAGRLLEQRVREWNANRRSSRYLFTRKELRLISRSAKHLNWETLARDKRELIAMSNRRLRKMEMVSITTIAIIVGIPIFIRSDILNLYLVRRELRQTVTTVKTEPDVYADMVTMALVRSGDLETAKIVSDQDTSVFWRHLVLRVEDASIKGDSVGVQALLRTATQLSLSRSARSPQVLVSSFAHAGAKLPSLRNDRLYWQRLASWVDSYPGRYVRADAMLGLASEVDHPVVVEELRHIASSTTECEELNLLGSTIVSNPRLASYAPDLLRLVMDSVYDKRFQRAVLGWQAAIRRDSREWWKLYEEERADSLGSNRADPLGSSFSCQILGIGGITVMDQSGLWLASQTADTTMIKAITALFSDFPSVAPNVWERWLYYGGSQIPRNVAKTVVTRLAPEGADRIYLALYYARIGSIREARTACRVRQEVRALCLSSILLIESDGYLPIID